jgi:hypothetical protein
MRRPRPELLVGTVVGVVALVLRLVLWMVYGPVAYGDTNSYFRSAEVLARLTFNGLDGTRVPGYPAFVALAGTDPERVFAAQLVLGWAITMLLFLWGWQVTRRAGAAAAVALAYTLSPAMLLFEANLLTETLTTFLLVLSFVLLISLERARGWAQVLAAAALGAASGAAGLVRILFYPLAIWLAPFVATSPGGGWKGKGLRLGLFLLPAALLLGGWIAFVYNSYGFLAPSTMGGYNLVQHTGVFFELLPDEDAVLRDVYLKYRDERFAERGDQTNTIWEAIPELSQASGLGFYDLAREMQRLSIKLIRAHPDLYLRNVAQGWLAFWKSPVYWDPAQAASPAVAAGLRLWAAAGRVVTLAANVAFLALSLWIVLQPRRYLDLLMDRLWLAPWGFIWLTSFVQTVIDHGDNPRFLIPLQPIVFLVVIVGGLALVRGRPLEAAVSRGAEPNATGGNEAR